MPPQIKTLIPLFVVFIGLFLAARYFLIPESFGQYGHYRGNSLAENADKPISFAGKAACLDCHPEINDSLQTGRHAELACEVCHGPGAAHVLAPDSAKLVKPGEKILCLTCHATTPARPENVIKQVNVNDHFPEKNRCIDCHNPHIVWKLKN